MGHMLKNTKFKTGSYTLGVPVGSNSVGPDAPVVGQTRYNTNSGTLEFYANVTGTLGWNRVANQGNVFIVKDTFTATGSDTLYGPMSYSYAAGQEPRVIAVVNNILQNPGVAFNFLGNNKVNLTSTPLVGETIYILHNYASTTANIA